MKFFLLPLISLCFLGCEFGNTPTDLTFSPQIPSINLEDVTALSYLPEELAYQDKDLPLDLLNLPDGFKIEVFATRIEGARSMTLSEKGIVYVGSRKEGKVYALEDRDKNGKVDRVDVIAEGLRSPNGVAWKDGDLYVAEISRVLRFKDIDENRSDTDYEVLVDDYPSDASHGWKFIRFGPDGKLYVPVGAPCNVCEEENPIYSSITRINPDGTGREIVAEGIRNTVGFDWHPETGELWFTENGRDSMGDNIPPDELNRVETIGQHFGFPYCHGGDIADPVFGKERNCSEFIPPVQKLGPHVAALGMRFYTGNQFPDSYKNQIFLAEHGSWNRSSKIGYQVSLVRLDGNNSTSYETFIDGWLQGENPWGRPVDVQENFDGSLYISDDYSGTIYRVWYEKEQVIEEALPAEEETITAEKKPEKINISGEDSPLSLKSFLEGEFIGTDFTIGNMFKEWGTHKSYYATYMSDGLKISSTFHVPSGEGPFPVLILNHGYFPPETYKNGYGFGREQKYFAKEGYAVLHIDYRGYAYSDKDPEAITGRRFGYTGYSADAVNAILALKEAELPYLDMNRVGMFGHSMGGGVTLNATLARPDLLKASVLWGPVSADYEDNYLQWTQDRMTPEATQLFESEFGSLEDPESFKALSPLTYLDRLQTPLLIQHGTADESCPIEWSRNLETELKRLGKDYIYTEYEGAPHVFWYDIWDNAAAEALAFFEEHL